MCRFRYPAILLTTILTTVFVEPRQAFSADAAKGASEYIDGLTSLTTGKFDAALPSIDKAIVADSENASYHTARAVVLYLQDKPDIAAIEIERATKLGNSPATQLWGWANAMLLNNLPDDLAAAVQQRRSPQSRLTQFDTRPPYESKEPYARQLIEPAMHYATPITGAARAQIKQQLVQAAEAFAWNELAGPKLAPSLMLAAKALYDQQKYAEALALLDRLRVSNANDPNLLYLSAGCKLFGGDYEAARDEYTKVLMQWSQHANSFLGRARAAAYMGAMERAEKDFASAASIDPKATEVFKAAIAEQLKRNAASVPSESVQELLAALKQSASDTTVPMDVVIAKAEALMRKSIAARFIPAETYTEEIQRLESAAAANPKNIDKQVAFAEFLVDPVVSRPVRLAGQTGTAIVSVGDSNHQRAQAPLDKALSINPTHIKAITIKAAAAPDAAGPNGMLQWIEKSMALGGNNLMLSGLYLDHYTDVADDLANRAAVLRKPTIRTEQRPEGLFSITTYPSQAQLAQAAEMERQADELRRKAVGPLRQLMDSAKGTVDGDLANAEYFQWTGKYDQAIAAAQGALKKDPFSHHAHAFIVDLAPKIQMMDLAIEHQDILDNFTNPSATRTLNKVWELVAATKYQSAKQSLDEAEKLDPASSTIPAYRAAIAVAEKNSAELTIAARHVVAMEAGRQRVVGRPLDASSKSALNPEDVALTMAVRHIWAADLFAQRKFGESAEQYRNSIILGMRVPAARWDTAQATSALPLAENVKKDGTTIRQLLVDGELQCCIALLQNQKPEDSAKLFMAYLSTSGATDLPPDAANLGYQIYQKLGPAKAAQVFSQPLVMRFQMMQSGRQGAR